MLQLNSNLLKVRLGSIRDYVEAKSVNDGVCHETFLRIGRRDDRIFLDLGDADWRAASISPDDWQVIDQPPVKFLRPPQMKPLPVPEKGELLESILQPFINVSTESDFRLIVSWLIAALFDKGPYPILAVGGEQGSGKSTVARLLRMLVDPNKATNRAAPRDERDLLVSAFNSWVLSFDNLSGIPNWFSDALCRLNSNGGFSTRALHTDMDEVVLQVARPIILNGIPDLSSRADLGDRSITITLPAIPEELRRSEDEYWSDFEKAWPLILGGLLDALSAGLRNLPNVQLERKPRMADFAKKITAAESGLGWEPGAFMVAYEANRNEMVEVAFDSDHVARVIRDNIRAAWEGTATELIEELGSKVGEDVRKSRFWPKSPSAMGNALKRAAPILRKIGFTIEHRRSEKRMIIIEPPAR